MLTPETTNANAEATQQTPGGRIKNWVKQNDQYLKGAATAGIGMGIGATAYALTNPPPKIGIDPEILDHVKENTVTIITKAYDKDGNELTLKTQMGGETDTLGHGSGAFLDETNGRLLGTAGHVVSDIKDLPEFYANQLPPGAYLKHFVIPNEGEHAGQLLEVKTTKIDAEGNDIAILDLGRTTSYTGIEFGGSAEMGQTGYLIGTPLDRMHTGTLKKITISASDGHRIAPDGKSLVEQATEDLVQLDEILYGGFSGGFIVDTNGKVIAIVTHGLSNTSISFATQAKRLEELKESYMKSPEFLNGPQTSGTPASGAEEAAAAAATQNGADTEAADATLNGQIDPDYQQTGSGSHWKGGKKGPPNGQKEPIDAAEHADLLAPHIPQSATDFSTFAIEPMQKAMMQNAMCSPIHGCHPLKLGLAAEKNVVDVDVDVEHNTFDLLEILGSLGG